MTIKLIAASREVLDSFASLKSKIPSMAGSFIADSDRVVLKLLASGLDVLSVLATPEWYAEHEAEIPLLPTVMFYVANKPELETIVGYALHQGVMAKAKIPADASLSEFFHAPMIVLDGIAKAENVGAIVRNAGAFGVWNMLVSPDSCHPYNRRSARVAMGNLFKMKIRQTQDLPAALKELKLNGVQIYAFENREFARNLHEVKFNQASALIIGSEGAGISPAVLELADYYVRIPIDQHVYALNAACASAVGLYAFSRQIADAKTE